VQQTQPSDLHVNVGVTYPHVDSTRETCCNLNVVQLLNTCRSGVPVEGPRHGLRYGALDRAYLTKHLLEMARDVGVDKVTMRGLAAHAGTSTASVYYHVEDKNALLDLLIEAVVESIGIPTAGTWEARLIMLYTNAWRVLLGVPGIAALLQQRPHTQAARNMDRATRKILHESGLSKGDFGPAHAVLYTHLLGSVELEHSRKPDGQRITKATESVYLYGLDVILSGLKSKLSTNRNRSRS
jgi:TetR/AcrR family tetracycline transcriptional repressor